MKDLVKKVKSFMTFDFPLQTAYISTQFSNTHARYEVDIPRWSTTATRQKVIATYWFSHVLKHCGFILAISALLVLLIKPNFQFSDLSVVFLAALTGFPIMLLVLYWQIYAFDFLPKLETIKESYERKQTEQLEKCRKAQLPNPTLILIHYVMDITSGVNAMQANEKFVIHLMKLYGVDPRSLKSSIELLLGSSIKRKGLKGRGRTEILNRFAEAYQFFEELHFSKGMEVLKVLEAKFLQSAGN